MAPLDEHAAIAAVTAARAGSALVLGEPAAARVLCQRLGLRAWTPLAPARPSYARSPEPWVVLARRAVAAETSEIE